MVKILSYMLFCQHKNKILKIMYSPKLRYKIVWAEISIPVVKAPRILVEIILVEIAVL